MKNNEHGYTLFLVMLVIVLVSVLGITLITASSTTNNTVVNERTDQSTYYVAEAGINLEKAKILQILKDLYVSAQQQFNILEPKQQQMLLHQYGSFNDYYNATIVDQYCSSYNLHTNTTNCTVHGTLKTFKYTNKYYLGEQYSKQPISHTTVSLDCTSLPCEFTLHASGYFENDEQKARELNQTLKVQTAANISPETADPNSNGQLPPIKSPIDNVATLTTGNITLTGGAKISGDATTSGGTLSLSGGTIVTGNIHANNVDYPEYMRNDVTGKIKPPINISLSNLLPEFPATQFAQLSKVPLMPNEQIGTQNNKLNIIQGGNFQATNYLAQNYELTLKGQHRFNNFEIGIDNTIHLNIGSETVDLYVNNFDISRGHIKIIGTGTLNLYVNNSLNFHGSFNKDGNPNNLNIFYKGSDKLQFAGDANISGTIYTQTSDIQISGGAQIFGNIYSGGKNIYISGGVKTNGQYIVAPNAHLTLTGGGRIIGTVIAKSLEGSGGTEISFGQPVVPLPTLPSTPTIIIPDTNNYIYESALTEI